MSIKCILIDDEPFALEILADDLQSFDDIEVLETFTNPHEALDYLTVNTVDLIFSDIQMPEMLGTDLLRKLEKPPLFIFTTAYHQYAVEGFELNAIDYLMKPIRRERLALSLEKVRSQMKLMAGGGEEKEKPSVTISVEYKKVKLLHEEILYIEGLKDYVKIYLLNRVHPVLTRSNLKGMIIKINSSKFLRIHNSFVINKDHIQAQNKSTVRINNQDLPIGNSYASAL
ncbi:LytR/AlgR family response regulator transcription factor [Jiulongibacter sp. NS-SX5]|uniref:LytR/AlgR family response regulator transcription factor n=1 Tax=Jiulongibacter sp. NS-SX5 TaxID=3463854 RepID=UPI0040597CB9